MNFYYIHGIYSNTKTFDRTINKPGSGSESPPLTGSFTDQKSFEKPYHYFAVLPPGKKEKGY
jgi:hypothetical protein